MQFCNYEMVKSSHVLPCDISDHFAIKCTVNSQIDRKVPHTITKRDFSHFNADSFFDQAKYLNFFKAEEMDCPHQAASFLENLVVTILDQHAPFKTTVLKYNKLAWKASHITKLIKQRNKLYKIFKDKGLDKNSLE
jgi:hypothetical protein